MTRRTDRQTNTPTPTDGRTGGRNVAREHVTFDSGGERCDGWLFRSEGNSAWPCVVMAHGFGGIRAARLDAFAERFAEAGIAALVYDYRHLGTSAGQPRGLIDIRRQREDYRSAVAHARGVDYIDPTRIALWGTSFSGGHVLEVAAADPRIAAAVLTNPYVDGLVAFRKARRAMGLKTGLRLLRLALADRIRERRQQPPARVPLTGPPGSTAIFTTPDAEPGFASIS
jgi:dienelactone hydrolase